jgi:mRNA interferase MazF
MPGPRRGEIWLVEFEPQRGVEIRKTRPAIVISVPEIEILPLRIVIPLRERKPHHEMYSWLVSFKPTAKNGLKKESSADTAQVKSFSTDRFIRRIGVVTESELTEVLNAVGLCIGL